MSGQTWTPAPKKGVIPLHPMTFGMLLGKSFAALRHNPKVMFGFAVAVQLVVILASTAVMGFVFFTTFTRLDSISTSSPDFGAIVAGTVALNVVAGIGVGLASVAFTSIVQGLVAAEVGFAALGVKSSLGGLWRKMAPAFWRIAAFSMLSVLAVLAVLLIGFGIVMALIGGGMNENGVITAVIIIVAVVLLASIPLTVWLSTKLLLVPSALVLERAHFKNAFVRSWRLTRGRFWSTFGLMFLVGLIMGAVMQVVALPASLLSGVFSAVLIPTGDPEPSQFLGLFFAILLPQVLLLVIQAITLVVQSTAGTLVYLDSRMRYEGLDQTLIAHLERLEMGYPEDQLSDPFAVDPTRAVTSTPPMPAAAVWTGAPAAYPAPAAYGYPSAPPAYQPAAPAYQPATPTTAPDTAPASAPETAWAPPSSGDHSA